MKRLKYLCLVVISFVLVFLSYFYLKDNKRINLLAVDYSGDNAYSVIFDANGGKLEGFATVGFEEIRDGVYGLTDTLVTNQPDGVEYSKKDNYYILYWSKDHNCSTKDLDLKSSFNTSGHTVYYACYEEKNYDNGGIRYAQDGAFVSGDNVICGDSLHITKCYKKWKYLSGRDYGPTEYCEYDEINGNSASGVVYRMKLGKSEVKNCTNTYTAYFYEDSVDVTGTGMECGSTNFYQKGVCTISGSTNQSVSTPDTSRLIKDGNGKKFIGWAADDDGKNVNCSGELVTGSSVKLTENVSYYACYESDDDCSNSSKITNGKGEYEVKVCYETYNEYGELLVRAKSDDIDELVSCADGFTLDNITKTNIVDTTCTKEGNCYRKYNVNCVGERPKISASIGTVQDNGYGYVNFSGESSVGIKAYYASSYYLKPTKSSNWINDSRGTYSIPSTPGTVFLWVMDNNNQISYAAMTSVIDKVNTDTTLKTLEIKGDNGESLNTETYAFDDTTGITSSDYVRLSNSLLDKSMLAKGFNPFDTAYKVTTNSEKISVYATLTSNDASYVSGYEPREVTLDYGVNTILIKIKNKKGKERTYTIIVTREDDRDNSNYLNSITLSDGKIKFDKYTSDYIVSVGKNKKSVSVGAELASLNASFVDSYGPRKVELKNNSTTVALKVQSETGSIRAYTITFLKDGEETKESDEALLSSLSLSKAYIAFDNSVSDYNTTVDYEVDSIDIFALSLNGGDAVNLYRTINGVANKINSKDIDLNVGNNLITIIVSTSNGKSRTYTVNILRKEDGLEISNDTSLSMLGVDGYDIQFKPDKLDYEIKIKNEKTLVIAATPMSNRADVYIRGNDNLTAFSIVKIKVVSEDGQFREYTIDIKKDTVNKTIEILAICGGVIIIVCGIIIIRIKKRRKSINSYYA